MDTVIAVGDTNRTSLLSQPTCSQDVVHLQCALAAVGVFQGDIDGSFGPATSKALAQFESSRGLPESGALTEETAKLLGWRKAESIPSRLPAITTDLVTRLFSGAARPHIEANLPHVLNALAELGLADLPLIAMALATIRVEASLFLPISELPSPYNTSPGGKPFDLYDHRAALGNLGAPDGSRFRGRGFIQLTGRNNYAQFSGKLNLGNQLVTNPFMAHESATSSRILAAFLKAKESRIRSALTAGRLPEARRLINGGSNGLAEFISAYRLALEVLPKQLKALD